MEELHSISGNEESIPALLVARLLQYRPETRIDSRPNGPFPTACCGESHAARCIGGSREENQSANVGLLGGSYCSGCAPRDGDSKHPLVPVRVRKIVIAKRRRSLAPLPFPIS